MSMTQNIIDIADIKAYLKTKNDSDDAVLEMLADNVVFAFERFTKRTLRSTSYAPMLLDGNGLSEFYAPEWPITALASISEDGIALTLNTDFSYDASTGRFVRLGCAPVWSDLAPLNLSLSLTAGYTASTLPSDLKLAALKQIALEFQRYADKSFNETSRSLGGQSTQVLEDEFAIGVVDVLRRHSRHG